MKKWKQILARKLACCRELNRKSIQFNRSLAEVKKCLEKKRKCE